MRAFTSQRATLVHLCHPELRSQRKGLGVHPIAVTLVLCLSPTRQEGVVRFEVESTFAMLLHHTLLPERIPPSIPPEGSASGSRPVSRQSIPPEWSTSGSRPVSRQKSPPVDPAQYPARQVRPSQYPARVVRQWIPPSFPPEDSTSGSCPVSRRR